jgi:LysM repeat protein
MSKRSSVSARVLAVIALVGAAAIILFVVVTSLDNGSGSGNGGSKGHVTQGRKKDGNGKQSSKAAYVVQSGDTLSSISQETGVPLSQILKLNPGVDPQILISGEKLKLR